MPVDFGLDGLTTKKFVVSVFHTREPKFGDKNYKILIQFYLSYIMIF